MFELDYFQFAVDLSRASAGLRKDAAINDTHTCGEETDASLDTKHALALEGGTHQRCECPEE